MMDRHAFLGQVPLLSQGPQRWQIDKDPCDPERFDRGIKVSEESKKSIADRIGDYHQRLLEAVKVGDQEMTRFYNHEMKLLAESWKLEDGHTRELKRQKARCEEQEPATDRRIRAMEEAARNFRFRRGLPDPPSMPTTATPRTRPPGTPAPPPPPPTVSRESVSTPSDRRTSRTQCPPGEFWDGTKCRGAVDFSRVGPGVATGGETTAAAPTASTAPVAYPTAAFGMKEIGKISPW